MLSLNILQSNKKETLKCKHPSQYRNPYKQHLTALPPQLDVPIMFYYLEKERGKYFKHDNVL